MQQFAGIRFTSFFKKGILFGHLSCVLKNVPFGLSPFSFVCRLEKQRKKLQREYLLKDLKDEKDEKLEKVTNWTFYFSLSISGSFHFNVVNQN